jgi:6-phosphogluconolactonase
MATTIRATPDQHILNLLIGSYTTNGTEGIYIYRFDAYSGQLTYHNRTPVAIENPTYLCVTNDNRYVYSVNENVPVGSVSAFAFNAAEGSISLLNTQPSGAGPCYISVDRQQQHVFAANYVSGSVYVFPINEDGSLAPASRMLQEQGSGPDQERQEASHVHTAILSPDEEFLLYTDLGADTLNIYRYDPTNRSIGGNKHTAVNVPPGEGPRHLAFSADHRHIYLVTEMGGNVLVFDHHKGELELKQTISLVEDGFSGKISGADIHLSPNGKFLYASNRGDANEIVVYSVDTKKGTLNFVERKPSGGIEPRNFVIAPTGNYLLAANQKSNNIVVFKINDASGTLQPTGVTINIDSPSCLKLVPVS